MFRSERGDASAVVDELVQSRVALGIQDATALTYHSHLNMIEKTCAVFGALVCPAHIQDKRHVATMCNNPKR